MMKLPSYLAMRVPLLDLGELSKNVLRISATRKAIFPKPSTPHAKR
jgi:hypothetical protein